MQNPFAVAISRMVSHPSMKAKELLVELSCDTSLKIKLEALSHFGFI
jgi:hypothetical protein